jgi:hypothetical protein
MVDRATRLSIGSTGRYLVDRGGAPTFLNGDTAWSIVASLLPDEVDRYLADRASRGFNAVIVNAIEALFTADPPRTVDGIEPFTVAGDLGTPDPAYWARVDGVIDAAAAHGIHVLLAPLYLGYAQPAYPGFGFTGRDEGWWRVVAGMTDEQCHAYGRFLGRRYADRDNLVWVIGGDRNPGDLRDRLRALVAGIRAEDGGHLVTAHVHPESSPVDEYEGDDWLSLNQTYTYGIVHRRLLEDHARAPVRPFVLFESTYEGEHDATELQVRRQAWWALTCGATGQFFGNFPVWLMPPGWEAALDSPGARAMAHLGAFVRTLPWWTLAPDIDRRVLVAGLGEETGLDRATAAVDPGGSLVVAYIPTPRIVSVDLGTLDGWITRVRWFDPVTGAWSEGGVHTRRGVVQIATPADHDAVLVLDDPGAGRRGRWPSS